MQENGGVMPRVTSLLLFLSDYYIKFLFGEYILYMFGRAMGRNL